MASQIDELSINYTEDDILLVKETGKSILSKGAWTTIIFRYEQWEKKKEAYSPERYTIRRYRKMNGEYKQQNKFNISSKDQAKKIINALETWVNEE